MAHIPKIPLGDRGGPASPDRPHDGAVAQPDPGTRGHRGAYEEWSATSEPGGPVVDDADKPGAYPGGHGPGVESPGGRRSGGPFHPARGSMRTAREPALMVPGAVLAAVVVLAGIQLVRGFLPWDDDLAVLAWFAFIPARYTDAFHMFPGGVGADAWTFLTYALLHGSWMHVISNCIWLVAFGSAVARRFGPVRFFALAAAAAVGGAAVHLALHPGEGVPVVGASAAIAGLMAAATRFVFDRGAPLVVGANNDNAAFRRPARTLGETLRNRSALFFVLVFFAVNLFTGVGSTIGGGVAIAWEAHIGGFLVGLLTFRWFDPVPRGFREQ